VEKLWPALDLSGGQPDLMLAGADECAPSAVEDRLDGLRLFFTAPAARDAAIERLREQGWRADALEVSDENWAERSQADLKPVTVGRLTVSPRPEPGSPRPGHITIPPSTAFGTGHHATTRLCLAALQQVAIAGRRVLDVGTGSGLLAIAAARLGAADVLGIDNDPDAVQTARGNLALNGGVPRVRIELADLRSRGDGETPPSPHDVVVANLTAALLVAAARDLSSAVCPGGRLVLSGLLTAERDEVVAALAPAIAIWEDEEDGWAVVVLEPLGRP
jgi:ribosomal protein L11 methyltransferase